MTPPLRVVMDTSVLVAALRSATGASSRFVRELQAGNYRLLLSNTLLLEYESVLSRPEQVMAHHLTSNQLEDLLTSLSALSEPVFIRRQYRPQLRDADDEHVFEAAVNGRAHMIVTHNVADFLPAAFRFRIQVVRPGDIIQTEGLV